MESLSMTDVSSHNLNALQLYAPLDDEAADNGNTFHRALFLFVTPQVC